MSRMNDQLITIEFAVNCDFRAWTDSQSIEDIRRASQSSANHETSSTGSEGKE